MVGDEVLSRSVEARFNLECVQAGVTGLPEMQTNTLLMITKLYLSHTKDVAGQFIVSLASQHSLVKCVHILIEHTMLYKCKALKDEKNSHIQSLDTFKFNFERYCQQIYIVYE